MPWDIAKKNQGREGERGRELTGDGSMRGRAGGGSGGGVAQSGRHASYWIREPGAVEVEGFHLAATEKELGGWALSSIPFSFSRK